MTMILLKSVKLFIKIAFSVLAVTVFTATSASSQTTGPLPSADDVVSRMMRSDIERRSELTGYTALRRYVVVSKDRQAEMVVRLDCSPEGTKQFTIISEEGSSAIRKHVFYKMLREESEMSRRETRDSSRITPANYKFYLVGRQNLDTGPAYVLTIFPENREGTPHTGNNLGQRAGLLDRSHRRPACPESVLLGPQRAFRSHVSESRSVLVRVLHPQHERGPDLWPLRPYYRKL